MKKHELDKEKIFLIKNKLGEFINVENPKQPYFTSKLYLGSYATIKGKKGFDRNIEYLNKIGTYGCLEIHETTIYEHLASSASEISSSIIILDLASKKIQVARDIIPNISEINKDVRNSMTNTSKKLKFINPLFDGCCQNNDDFTFENQGNYDELITEVSKVEMWSVSEAVEVLKAFNSNKKTILGSARRVNKNSSK